MLTRKLIAEIIETLERVERQNALDHQQPSREHNIAILESGRSKLIALVRRIDKAQRMVSHRNVHKDQQADAIPVPISINQTIHAISVPSFQHVRHNGHLHYVTDAECFAIRIDSVLLHGNVGICGAGALRTVECRFGPRCGRRSTCPYYHDPLTCGGGDRRDWRMAISMPKTQADIRRMRLLAMHLLLCTLGLPRPVASV